MSEVVVFDTKHSKSINDCVLDYYAKRLATCSSDNSVKVFDVSSLSSSVCIAELRDHSSAVWKVCWSHPKYGGLLASCSYDKSVIVYKELEANKYGKIYINTEHKGSINSIEWAPYDFGLHLGCASSDGYISIVSYNLNKENSTEGCWHRYYTKAHLNGVSCISWEKKSNAFVDENNLNDTSEQINSFKLVSGGFDHQVIVWLFDNNSKEFHKLFQMRDEPHKTAVKDVAWKPNAGSLINIIASCSDQQVILWEEDVNTNVWINKQVIYFQHKIDKITWSPNGTILAVSCDNENVFLYKENEEGVWNNLCNLGSTETDFPSNSIKSASKEYANLGYTDNASADMMNFQRGGEGEREGERARMMGNTPYAHSYQQPPVNVQTGFEGNPADAQSRNYSVSQIDRNDRYSRDNRDIREDLQQSQPPYQVQPQPQSHMHPNSMEPPMNVGYSQQGPSAFTSQQMAKPGGGPPSAVTNPNPHENPSSSYFAPPSQRENKTLNRPGTSVTPSSAYPPADYFPPDARNSLPSSRVHAANMNVANVNMSKQNMEPTNTTSQPMYMQGPPLTSTPRPPQAAPSQFSNVSSRMDTGHMNTTSSYPGQVTGPTYIPAHRQPNPPAPNINSTTYANFAPFNQNAGKEMPPPMNVENTNSIGIGSGGGPQVPRMHHEQSAVTNASNLIGNVKPMSCPPPPPPSPFASAAVTATASMQPAGPGAPYGKTFNVDNTGMVGNVKPYGNQNEHSNFSAPPPMNRSMN